MKLVFYSLLISLVEMIFDFVGLFSMRVAVVQKKNIINPTARNILIK
jgi:hypothetical protein